MPLVQAKCTNCGASLQVDGTKDAAICPYCGTPFIVEKAINYYNTTNQISANVVNIYGDTAKDFIIRGGKLEKYNGSSPDVVIPNTVSVIGEKAFENCSALTSVVMPDSVVEIEKYAFSDCSRLEKIELSNSLTIIKDYAFNRCASLTDITIPNSAKEIGGHVFGGCTSISHITIPNGVSSIVCFQGCTGLSSITIPNSVTHIGVCCFFNCTSLKSITIPNSVKRIGEQAFAHCTGLRDIIIPDSVTEIGDYAFTDCTGLRDITIPDSVKRIGRQAFSGCVSLSSITIPASVEAIGVSAFENCGSLKKISIPGETRILESVFDGCSGIEELTLGKIQYKNQKEDYDSLEGDWVWAIYPFKDNCESIRKVSAPAPALHGFLKDCPNLDKDTLVYMKQQLTQMKETLQKQLRSIGMFALDPEGKKEKLKTKIKWLSEDLSQLNRRLRN